MGAATPGPSGPWMCEIVAGLLRSDHVSFTVMKVSSLLRANEPAPVAVVACGGVS